MGTDATWRVMLDVLVLGVVLVLVALLLPSRALDARCRAWVGRFVAKRGNRKLRRAATRRGGAAVLR